MMNKELENQGPAALLLSSSLPAFAGSLVFCFLLSNKFEVLKSGRLKQLFPILIEVGNMIYRNSIAVIKLRYKDSSQVPLRIQGLLS